MSSHRRISRALALALAAAAIAVPGSAAAMPASDPAGANNSPIVEVEPRSTAMPEAGGGDQTLALVVSGAALLVAIGGAGHARRTGLSH